jgi:hypothetical protein
MNCYIDLSETNYNAWVTDYKLFADYEKVPVERMLQIYQQYADYKKFKSVWPIYPEEFTAKQNDIIGYYDQNRLVAWSMIYKINAEAVEAIQFAWDYKNPKLKLGIESMKTECAIYKDLGYKIIILGEAHNYKRSIDGFREFGSRNRGLGPLE